MFGLVRMPITLRLTFSARRRLELLVGLLVLCGCHSLPHRPMITLDEIVRMSQAGNAPNEIVAKLEQHQVQLEFTGSQLAKLKAQGVPDEVLDYLLNAYAHRIRSQVRWEVEPVWWQHPFYHHPRLIIENHPRRL